LPIPIPIPIPLALQSPLLDLNHYILFNKFCSNCILLLRHSHSYPGRWLLRASLPYLLVQCIIKDQILSLRMSNQEFSNQSYCTFTSLPSWCLLHSPQWYRINTFTFRSLSLLLFHLQSPIQFIFILSGSSVSNSSSSDASSLSCSSSPLSRQVPACSACSPCKA